MASKVPKSFKFSGQVARWLEKLGKLPRYGNQTRVIEALVSEAAEREGIVKSRDNHNETVPSQAA